MMKDTATIYVAETVTCVINGGIETMDSNGYNESLFDTHAGTCWYCHQSGDTVRHEVFGGVKDRAISKKVGTWLYLCPRCHMWVHGGVHISSTMTLDEYLKNKAEELFKNTYKADFNKIFYGAPKRWELEALAEEVKEREQHR